MENKKLSVGSADWKEILITIARGLAEMILNGDTKNMDFGIFGTEIALEAYKTGKKFDMSGCIDLKFYGEEGTVEVKISRPEGNEKCSKCS